MNLSQENARRRSAGFTLVEIMIVVAIIGVLAALAVPGFARARQTAQRTYLTDEIRLTMDAFQMYENEHQKLPLETASTGMSISTAGAVPAGMEPYMPKNSHWTTGTYGTWYWIYWPSAAPPYKGMVYLADPRITTDDLAFYDQKLDDGNINTGAMITYGPGTMMDMLQ